MLKRYTRNIVLSYDADEAGQRAALRGMDILKKEGCRVHILRVTDGKDPDEFVKKRGKEAFLELARNAMSFADFKLDIAKKRHDLTKLEGRVDYLKDAVNVLSELSPVEADMYIKKIADENDISEGAIRAEMGRRNDLDDSRRSTDRTEEQVKIPPTTIEKYLIKVLLTDSSYLENRNELNNVLRTPAARGIYNAILQVYNNGEEIDIMKLEDILDDEDVKTLEEIRERIKLAGKTQEIYSDCVSKLKKEELREREQQLMTSISMAEGTANQKMLNEMMKELSVIQKELSVRGK
jgi:DNA primase